MSCEEDAAIEQELAYISSIQEGNDTQTQKNVQDCCCRLVALASAGKPTTGASPASTTSTTPQLSGAENDDDVKAHPAFHVSYHPRPEDLVFSQSLAYCRPGGLVSRAYDSMQREASAFNVSIKDSSTLRTTQLSSVTAQEVDADKISRSISDTTLRKAALSLNLTQSVLPSFTSIQQFKASFDQASLN